MLIVTAGGAKTNAFDLASPFYYNKTIINLGHTI